MSTLPNSGATELVAAQASAELAVNAMGRRLDSGFTRAIIEDRDLSSPPGTCADGACYLVAGTGTGAWSGYDGKMMAAVGTNAANGWLPHTVAKEGFQLYVKDENLTIEHNGTSWQTMAGSVGGVQSTPIMAAAMTARTTSGAAVGSTETTTNKVMLPTLDFDASTIEYAQFLFPFPKSWNEGTVTVQFIWTATSSSGDVIWGCQGVAISNDDALDVAFGTAQEVTDTLTATGDQCTTSFTSAITIGGSPAEGDLVAFQVYRKASDGSDTLGADAKLIGIRLNFTTNAADDS